ncbi:MAG: hypothetical protein H6719_29860 [Sandaracinaceae bacterium]|nr:hypothetical protein [Sandaracinaceae bacterium]
MQPSSPHFGFPASLDQVPAHAVAVETFGFTPLSLALGGLLGLLGSLVGLATHGMNQGLPDLYLPAGCLAGLLVFGGFEVWRRRSKTALAFMGDHVAVYRAGQLAETFTRRGIILYRLSILNTIREVMLFGILGPFAILGGLATLAEPSIGLCVLGVGVGMTGAAASAIYARVACRHFFVPRGGTTEHVVFTRGLAERFGI